LKIENILFHNLSSTTSPIPAIICALQLNMGPSENVRFIDGGAADSGEYQTNTEACILMHENSGLLEGPGWLLLTKPPVVNDSMDVDGDNAGHHIARVLSQ